MAIKFLNTVAVDTDVLYVDAVNNRVGIGTAFPGDKLHVDGNIYLGASSRTIYTGGSGNLTFQNNTGNILFLRSNGASESMRINSSGHVGIGTTSPTRALDVSRSGSTILANFNNTGGTTSFISLGNTSSTADQIRLGSNGTALTLSTNYTERMRIDSSGNVGIGTTNPAIKLHVESSDETVARFERNSGSGYTVLDIKDGVGTTGNSIVRFSDTGGSPGEINYEHADNSLRINTNSSEKLRITSAGNVGVGTTSPDYKLEVSGTLGVSRTDGIIFAGSAVTGIGSKIASNTSNDLIFSTALPSSPYTTTERVRVLNSGNVGIGTTSPSKKLDVAGEIKGTNLFAETYRSARSDGDVYIQAATATDFVSIGTQVSANLMRIVGSGNVGIGTTSPSYTLDVEGPIRGKQYLYLKDTSGTNRLTIQAESTYVTHSIGALAQNFVANYYRFYDDTFSEMMRIADNGNVGIGVTLPESKLQVNGGVQLANDTDSPSASKVGTFRYYTSGNNSYVDMCMQTGAATYAWVNIVTNSW